MGQSYRIRTTPGDDKNIVIQVNQDFEQLEILSLKVRQQDVYTRVCSDYGIITGRVFSNRGFGIPNARLSIFIPLQPEDEDNPVITSIYPYKNLEQVNEDGYRYNLLPYTPSYPEHVPTGTFPTRLDNLTNPTAIEIYNKYYKYSVTTNEAGDFMIFGVPVGTQTLVMNVDLSDIGEFSLSPQDLIRMGIATESQFDGVKFKSSPNFETLPQIITLNKTVEVIPFWGEEDICRIGITRADFDLTSEVNLNIQPVAIFMGSIMSSNEKTGIKPNGRAKKVTGNLCLCSAGPGEILGITQTLFRDEVGLPILQQANFPNGGKLIDENGTWLFDLPMNLDYVYTNEFGEQVLSEDPKIGIPTKAKYRFKVKWQQSKNLNEDYKRAYFLIPNIRERGWSDSDINLDPTTGKYGYNNWLESQKSYAFSLSWSSYTTSTTITPTNQDILRCINCEDYFYEFNYNRVYTVSQLMDHDKRRRNRKRYLGIKYINDEVCQDNTNRYPVNDGNFNPTLIWVLFNILLGIIFVILKPFIFIYNLVAWIMNKIIQPIANIICDLKEASVLKVRPFGWINFAYCDNREEPLAPPLRFPMLTFPDCDVCDQDGFSNDADSGGSTNNAPESSAIPVATAQIVQEGMRNFRTGSPVNDPSGVYNINSLNVNTYFPGLQANDDDAVEMILKNVFYRASNSVGGILRTNDLNVGERINNFNTKGKFYDDNGGVNQIKVKYEPSLNNSDHYDNVIVFLIPIDGPSDPALTSIFSGGSMFSYVDPASSTDPNVKSNVFNTYYRAYNTTGTTTIPNQITLTYANPNNRTTNGVVTYSLPAVTPPYDILYSYPSDIEYFQVIQSRTLSDFLGDCKTYPRPASFAEIMKGRFYIYKDGPNDEFLTTSKISKLISENNCGVVIAQRGVDPYSFKYNTQVSLGKIYGFDNENDRIVNLQLRLNIPVRNTTNQGDQMMAQLNGGDNTTVNNGLSIFYPSYVFQPGNYLSYTTDKLKYYSSLDTTTNFGPNNLSQFANLSQINGILDVRTNSSNRLLFSPAGPPNGMYDGKIFFLNRNQSQSPYSSLDTEEGTPISTQVNTTISGVQTSGTLINGNRYIIIEFKPGDDFTGGGATSNTNGVIFTYNGGTITWNNDSKISRYFPISEFMTPIGSITTNIIPAGEWQLTQIADTSGTGVKLTFEIYKRNSSNVETLLPFTNNNVALGTLQRYKLTNSCPDITLNSSDRIVIKIFAYKDTTQSTALKTFFDRSSTSAPNSYLLTSFIRNDAKYSTNESFVGGTYISLENSTFSTTFSKIYSNVSYTMSNPTNIVLRTDRLPSSDKVQNESPGINYIFQQNSENTIYKLAGAIQVTVNTSTESVSVGTDNDTDYPEDNTGLQGNVLTTFSCENLVAIDCYQGDGLTLTYTSPCNDCDIEFGNYVFAREPLKDMKKQNRCFTEYGKRFRINYAFCQGIIGEAFINNWINGNLYAFPFKINTIYNKSNKVKKRKYAKLLVVLHEESNNFYYRSSPCTQSGRFVGMPGGRRKRNGNIFYSAGANNRNLRFPTTILDMGPKLEFLKNISLGPQFLGHVMDELSPTSYNDTDDLINLFAIVRLTQPKAMRRTIGNILKKMFSRDSMKVDADYAQSTAINSQFGVVPLDSEFYTSAPPNPDIVVVGVGQNDVMMGIFFDSSDDDLQNRDYISPKREIRFNPVNQQFRYDYIDVNSQFVPNYKWNVQNGTSIFGEQTNEWATNVGDIQVSKYQSLDRLTSNYHQGAFQSDFDKRGYMFGNLIPSEAQTYGTLVVGREYVLAEYEEGDDFSNVGATNETGSVFIATSTTPLIWIQGSAVVYRGQYQVSGALTPNPGLVGAPWYFYFGLVKGGTALHRFYDKYIGITLEE